MKSDEPIPEEFLATGVPTCQTNLSPLFTLMYAKFLKDDIPVLKSILAKAEKSDKEELKFKRLLLINSIMQDTVYNMQTLELIYGDPSAECFHELPLIHIEKTEFDYEYQINAQIPDCSHVGGFKLDIQIKHYGDSITDVFNSTKITIKYIKSTMPGVCDYADLGANAALLAGDLTGALDAVPIIGQAKSAYDIVASIEQNRERIEEANKQIDNQLFTLLAAYLGLEATTSVVNNKIELNYWRLTPVGGKTLQEHVNDYNNMANKEDFDKLDAQQIYYDFASGDYESDSLTKFKNYMYNEGYSK